MSAYKQSAIMVKGGTMAISKQNQNAEDFWNDTFSKSNNRRKIPTHTPPSGYEFVLPYVSGMRGKRVLDLGCGKGDLSIYLALNGAIVSSVDLSSESIHCVNELAAENGVFVSAFQADAARLFEVVGTNAYDYVVGRFILHHIEPFIVFAEVLDGICCDNALCVFYENSANNSLLIWCRNHLVGKYGIPKFGDYEEQPFSKAERKMLEKYFSVKIICPKFEVFEKLSQYIFRKNQLLKKCFTSVDNFVFKHLPIFHNLSYHQVLVLKRKDSER
jgi:2-polyprenyl-3-methyl-5-hydroxy-6-metoxy-1,4-benzoquinol methylase